jgi:predicted type IV restriction endonuclease
LINRGGGKLTLEKIQYKLSLKNNNKIDMLYNDVNAIKRFLNVFKTIKQLAISEGDLDIINVCLDIENAIKKCNFNNLQSERLTLWMIGYKEYEIADMCNISRVVIHNFLNNASYKISQKLTR